MKTKILLRVLTLMIAAVIYFFTFSGFKEAKSPGAFILQVPRDFINIILNHSYFEYPPNSLWHIENFMPPINQDNLYRELSYTGVQQYDNTYGSNKYGTFYNPLEPDQITNMRYLINLTTGPENDIRTVFERSKIARLCYSQRLVYEISPNGNTTENYGYCYQQCQGEYMIDQGRTVLLANDPAHQYPNGYYIARDVYENLQHSFLPYPWQVAENWIVKPVMRIDPNVVINYPEKEVVRIEIKKFNGELFDPIIIRARHFKDKNGNYYGEYRDKYVFFSGDSLNIPGDRDEGLNKGLGTNMSELDSSEISFDVYWPGQVNVWFDKMVVDDEKANDLFNGSHDWRIDDELNSFIRDTGPNNKKLDIFFADECIYSNLSSVKYVQNYINIYNLQYGTNAKLVYAGTNVHNVNTNRRDDLEHAFNLHLDSTRPQFFQIDAHCFAFTCDPDGNSGQGGFIPINALPGPIDEKVPDFWKKDNYAYNNYLQTTLGDRTFIPPSESWPKEGSIVFQITQARSQMNSKSPDSRLIVQPQLQNWAGIGPFINFNIIPNFHTNAVVSLHKYIVLSKLDTQPVILPANHKASVIVNCNIRLLCTAVRFVDNLQCADSVTRTVVTLEVYPWIL